VILYADKMTDSMKNAMAETHRRRKIQEAHNKDRHITPQGIKKAVKDITERVKIVAEERVKYEAAPPVPPDEIARLIKDLESQMKKAAKNLEFEKAALLRDRIVELRKDEELISPLHRQPKYVDHGKR
jgi:excinuclease ABC subunit B